jgi:hypothetical protein
MARAPVSRRSGSTFVPKAARPGALAQSRERIRATVDTVVVFNTGTG